MQFIPLAVAVLNIFKTKKAKLTKVALVAAVVGAVLNHWDDIAPHVPHEAHTYVETSLLVIQDAATRLEEQEAD